MEALAPFRYANYDGEKFPGGFGVTDLYTTDYWTLRARSAQLFKTNLYARGLIRRLVTNEINTGLHLECTPEESILGRPKDALADWSETAETRWNIWSKSKKLCDAKKQQTFGALQAEARREALIEGDVLCVLLQDKRTRLPTVQLISGSLVQTPIGGTLVQSSKGETVFGSNRIEHGVELNESGEHVAYWIRQLDGTTKRLEATGRRSGRKLAWLVYGTDKRKDEVRGEPLLSLIMQSLREVDRYRDSAQRKAVINSMLAMFISRTEDKPNSKSLTGGAVRKGVETTSDAQGSRTYGIQEQHPGMVLESLEVGEKPEGFMPHGTDEKFGDFEAAIIHAIAWANEIPPEILTLAFSSNYSASMAAINEFKIYLNLVRKNFGDQFCQPIYEDWLVSEVLSKRIPAPGLIEAWRNPIAYDVIGAWFMSDWGGHIKPAVDMTKLVRGYTEAIEEGLMTRDRACRELFGMKYSKVVQKLKRENEALVEANKSIVEAERDPLLSADETDKEENSNVVTPTRSSRPTAASRNVDYLQAAS